jgi:NADH dehydrogenase FAD-containing subunit
MPFLTRGERVPGGYGAGIRAEWKNPESETTKPGESKMGKHMVFTGGGHVHLTALLRLRDYVREGHRVTLIGPSPYHYYSGMGPGLLSGIYRPAEARFHVKKMAEDRGAAFLEDRVVKVEPARRTLILGSGEELRYDVVSFNTGSEVPADIVDASADNVFPVKPIENLLAARRKVLDASGKTGLRAIVVGGGAAGVEIAAALGRLGRESGRIASITLVSGSKVLEDYPAKARAMALRSLARWGVERIEEVGARSIGEGVVRLENGVDLRGDMVFVAVGVTPSSLFAESDLPTGKDGGLLVNDSLQCVRYPDLFGGGDCITLDGTPLERVGVYAVRQNRLLHRNLLAFLEGRPLRRFDPGGVFLTILNMGDGSGIFRRKEFVWDGPFAFRLKDAIDRRFMRKFQVSGERRESSREE